METMQLCFDGDHACALVGANIQEGGCEFVSPDDAPPVHETKVQRDKWAIGEAKRRLCRKLGDESLAYYHGSFYCDAYNPHAVG